MKFSIERLYKLPQQDGTYKLYQPFFVVHDNQGNYYSHQDGSTAEVEYATRFTSRNKAKVALKGIRKEMKKFHKLIGRKGDLVKDESTLPLDMEQYEADGILNDFEEGTIEVASEELINGFSE